MSNFVRSVFLLSLAAGLLLVVATGCAAKEEPAATPRPVVAPAPGAVAPTPVPATPTPAPAKVELTEWTIGTVEDPSIPSSPLVFRNVGVNRRDKHVSDPMWFYTGTQQRWQPLLGISYQYLNPNTLAIELRQGVKSHTGDEFTAEDVRYTLSIIQTDPKAYRHGQFKTIDSIETRGKYTVVVHSKEPIPLMVTYLSLSSTQILPKEREKDPVAFDNKLWGHGPYRLVKLKQDEPVILEAFADYYLGEPTPARLKLIFLREAASRLAAVLAGQIDIAEWMPVTNLQTIRGRPDLAYATIPNARYIFWTFNMTKAPFDKIKVRQAMNYALNKQVVVQDMLEGTATVARSLYHEGQMGGTPQPPGYPYDPVKAVRLLTEAGYSKGFEFNFMTVSGTMQKDLEISEAYVSMWDAVGLRPRMRLVERAQFLEEYKYGNGEVMGISYMNSDKDVGPGFNWLFKYCPCHKESAELDDVRPLIDQAWGTVDEKERAAIYQKINWLAWEKAIHPFSHWESSVYFLNRKTNWLPLTGSAGVSESLYGNAAKLLGYGPNYEKWDESLPAKYWNK